ncbi:MAG TPA: VWA domain-containing protein [Acidobacteriaceae bacterium]|jgi:VWFA-related protein|nr:VWA domain-containing protein [Acidobacteriaceae bacterium]
MPGKSILSVGLCASVFVLVAAVGHQPAAQEDNSRIFVNVVLVQLNVAVTDKKGNYVRGLKPSDFLVTEDSIPEAISSFEEGGEVAASMSAPGSTPPPGVASAPPAEGAAPPAPAPDTAAASVDSGIPHFEGASVFILFDTSDYMYRQFVFAQDAIAGFVRSMQGADKIAFYSYSRDLSRATALTSDRSLVLGGVRSTVAGDEAALYNCLLLTVRDAAQLHGRKAIVVFSNGPDNASSVPPEDVEELAQSTGTIIYIVSTRLAEQEPVSTAVFERMSRATGGKAYFARNWEDERLAFASIRDDLSHLYTLSYYPKPNPNRGWRRITVRLAGKDLEKYRVRTRDGYRLLQQSTLMSESASAR